MNSSRKKKYFSFEKYFVWAWSLFFMSAGLFFMISEGNECWLGLKTKNWPAAPGRIIESKIQSYTQHDSNSRLHTHYGITIRYSYVAAGQNLESNRLQYGYASHKDEWSASREHSRYPPGKEVQVFYDPTNPNVSVLVKGIGISWMNAVMGLLFFLIGLFVLVFAAIKGWGLVGKKAVKRRVGVGKKISAAGARGTDEKSDFKDRENYLRKNIDAISKEEFPDNQEGTYTILGFSHRVNQTYVEVEPHPSNVGYDKFKYLMDYSGKDAPTCVAVYCCEGGEYSLLYTAQGWENEVPYIPD